MPTIAEVKNHLVGMGGAASLDDVQGVFPLLERASNTVLTYIDPIETERIAALTSLVYDDVYNYSLPTDYKKIIDLYPQDKRTSMDRAGRMYAEPFDAQKLIREKRITIESSEGTKIIRINWRTGGSNQPRTLHSMESLTANGTWAVFGSATGLKRQILFSVQGNASIEFDLVASGDGIQNTTMTALDLTDEDEVADVFFWIHLPSAPTSISARWGNDQTTNFWTGVAQTAQADGTAFKVGWNLIRVPWSTATETGTVAPATIDSFRVTIANSAALTNVRVDQIRFIVGRNFDIKYYSQFAFKNAAGTFIAQPTTDDDTMILLGTGYQIFLLESRIAIAQQTIKDPKQAYSATAWERTQLKGDPQATDRALRMGLYAYYRAEYPAMSKKITTNYAHLPRFLSRRI